VARYFEQLIDTYAPPRASMPVQMAEGEQASPDQVATPAPTLDTEFAPTEISSNTTQEPETATSAPHLPPPTAPVETHHLKPSDQTTRDVAAPQVTQNIAQVTEQHDHFHIEEQPMLEVQPDVNQHFEGETHLTQLIEGDEYQHIQNNNQEFVTHVDPPAPLIETTSDASIDIPRSDDTAVALLEERLKGALAKMDQTQNRGAIIQEVDFEPEPHDTPPPSAPETIREVTREVTREVHHHHETTVQAAPEHNRPVTAAAASQIGPIQFASHLWPSSERR
jgi:hypothetical protein